MVLYDKFGWTIPLEDYVKTFEYCKLPPRFDYLIFSKKQDLPSAAENVAICLYLLGRKAEAAKFGKATVDAVIDFYYGSWRAQVPTDLETLDPEWWRLHTLWIDFFRAGLCWSTALGNWKAAIRMAEYPLPESPRYFGFTKEDKAFYLALASYIRGEFGQEYRSNLHKARAGKRRPLLLAAVLEAIQNQNQKGFQLALQEYLTYFRKSEFRRVLDKLLSYDGTTLLNLGGQQELRFVIPKDLEDYVIHL